MVHKTGYSNPTKRTCLLYLAKDTVKDIIPINYGGKLNYKLASVEQK
ncbi:hypothetical protein [Bacillus sp. NPDC094106]